MTKFGIHRPPVTKVTKMKSLLTWTLCTSLARCSLHFASGKVLLLNINILCIFCSSGVITISAIILYDGSLTITAKKSGVEEIRHHAGQVWSSNVKINWSRCYFNFNKWLICSMITAKLKSWITFWTECHWANFYRIDRGVQTLSISAHGMASMHALISLKWPSIT